ncbi:hypothetical protein PWY87_18180 [Kribbella solani]|uniref:hypothetical protein n=1 Tax=Kribbella solani TaxID=236067 RepID=UPI0029A66916|nr:hypothetical protein [Kribbella solani]MDX2974072.1 hypothetical protein [Kribbella solani]MDX3003621.1 hypothetical protein [Kribbella solani]
MTGRRLLNVGLTLAVLVAIVGLYRLTPTQKDIQQPTPVRGIVGRAVQTPRFDLTVDSIRIGKKLRIPHSTPDRDTLTDFVVVDASVTANREPLHIADVRIRSADGVTYLGSNRNGLDQVDLTGTEFAPDIPVRGSFVVEMPADKVPGATLLVMEKPILNDLEPQVTVPLGSDAPPVQDVVALTAASDT